MFMVNQMCLESRLERINAPGHPGTRASHVEEGSVYAPQSKHVIQMKGHPMLLLFKHDLLCDTDTRFSCLPIPSV